jgi:2-dehydro-3-deoxyphosphogluconate aldolase/(4S)-4-hydroxy-2-oxoglutarate aldolase
VKPEFKLAHVGVNPQGKDAEEIAQLFCLMLNTEYKPGKSSVFAGSMIEVMRQDYLGENGHIAFAVKDLREAEQYLNENGFSLDMATAKYGAGGEVKAVYIAGSFAGFAVHLLKI